MNKLLLFFISLTTLIGQAQDSFEITGLCIAAPNADGVDQFVKFMDEELGPNGINTLVLRVDFNYAYESRPELRDKNPLSKAQVKQMVAVAKKHGISLIPQVNLLGHQSWAEKTNKLLEVYPEFDETPHVVIPKEYKWPNADGLYCKSYCPLHPEVHGVVFDLMDEIVEIFEADAFHAGMDEVFYIADDKCPRCQGMDPATLFANEVNKISRHLQAKDKRLWIWGDRLIDASTSGIGMWEASMNNTARAVDMIDKSVVICDWHYEMAVPTPALFALKGLSVVSCPWRTPKVAVDQVNMMHLFKETATPKMKDLYMGVMQTVWSPAASFIESYHAKKSEEENPKTQEACFRAMLAAIKNLEM